MHASVDDPGAALLGQHFTSDNFYWAAVAVANGIPSFIEFLGAADFRPIYRRIAQQDTNLTVFRERGIHTAYFTKKPLKDWAIPHIVGLRSVLPSLAELIFGYVFSRNEPVHHLLIKGIAAFNYDIVHNVSKSGIPDQRNPKSISLFTSVAAVANRDDIVGFESFKNTGDRINRTCSYCHRVGSIALMLDVPNPSPSSIYDGQTGGKFSVLH